MDTKLKSIVAVLLLAAQSAVFAQSDWSVTVSGAVGDGSGTVNPLCNENTATGNLTVSCGASVGGAMGSGSATVRQGLGQLGVHTSATFSSSSAYGNGVIHANAEASFSDVLRINNPGQTGWGTLTFSLYLERTVTVSTAVAEENSQAATGSDIQAVAYINEYHSFGQVDDQIKRYYSTGVVETTTSSGWVDSNNVGNALGFQTFSVPFVFNQDFNMVLTLRGHTYAAVAYKGAAAGGLDAMNSLDWAGIQQVSVDGTAVEYALWSQSGIDWNRSFAPVPEPGTAWLLLAALPLIGGLARRRPRTIARPRRRGIR